MLESGRRVRAAAIIEIGKKATLSRQAVGLPRRVKFGLMTYATVRKDDPCEARRDGERLDHQSCGPPSSRSAGVLCDLCDCRCAQDGANALSMMCQR